MFINVNITKTTSPDQQLGSCWLEGDFVVDKGYQFSGSMHAGLKDWRAMWDSGQPASIFLDFLVSRKCGSKSTMRNYCYTYNGNILTCSDMGIYGYSQANAGPHAVTGITDASGTLLPQHRQSISYTAFNKASHISQGTKDYFITYGPDRLRRCTSLHNDMQDALLTKYYAFGDFEQETDATGTRQIHYITAGDGLAAVYVQNDGGTDSLYYIMKDHLGSLVGAINSQSNHVYGQSFDAWGRERNPTSWGYANLPDDFPFLRGYTGHEHLKWFGLINMNGRLYDPALCRFLSPDPYVQMPDYTQNFNRYSYALNNPLVFVDPDGEFFLLPAMMIGAFINITMQGWSGNAQTPGDFALAAGIGAVAGGVGAYAAPAACVSMGLSATGVTTGVVWGGTAGLTSGFIGGAGNSWANSSSFGDGLVDGLSAGGFGMMTGGILGGIGGGISSNARNSNIWSGAPNLNGRLGMTPMNLSGSALSYSGHQTRIQPILQGSELVYDDEINALQWVNVYSDGSTQVRDQWCAVSGPHGNGQLPQGEWRSYSITRLNPLTQSDFNSYSRDGFDFWTELHARFDHSRSGIGIHPDGQSLGRWWLNNGTLGCIGIQEESDALTRFYNMMRAYLSRNSYIPLKF